MLQSRFSNVTLKLLSPGHGSKQKLASHLPARSLYGLMLQAQLASTEEQHAVYVSQLAEEASASHTSACTQHADQLQALQAQHSAELSQLASQHQTVTEWLQQQLTETHTLIQEQHLSCAEICREDHKLMVSQLVTFLAWEKDDLALELSMANDNALDKLSAQHEQQLHSVQSTMLQQNVDALQHLIVSQESSVQSLIAQHADLTHALSQLHGVQLEMQDAGFGISIVHMKQTHAQELDSMQASCQTRLAEAMANHEMAMNKFVLLATQDSELAAQSLQIETGAAHAAEHETLRLSHQEHLAEITTQREHDQAESLSHLTQAIEQLSNEHAHSMAALESLWTDKQADQQEAFQQHLLDLAMQHDSFTHDLRMQSQANLEAAQACHDEQMSQLCLEHQTALTRLQDDTETEHQGLSVRLVNLQLQFEQTERKLTNDLNTAAAAGATVEQQQADMREQLKVR